MLCSKMNTQYLWGAGCSTWKLMEGLSHPLCPHGPEQPGIKAAAERIDSSLHLSVFCHSGLQGKLDALQ